MQAAVQAAGRVLEGVNSHAEHFVPETPLDGPYDVVSEEMAELILSWSLIYFN